MSPFTPSVPLTDITTSVSVALDKIGKPSVEPLIAVLNKQHHFRVNLAEVLNRIGNHAIGPLISALKHKNKHVRRTVAETLKKITRLNFGEDYEAWSTWWRENKHLYQQKQEEQ